MNIKLVIGALLVILGLAGLYGYQKYFKAEQPAGMGGIVIPQPDPYRGLEIPNK